MILHFASSVSVFWIKYEYTIPTYIGVPVLLLSLYIHTLSKATALAQKSGHIYTF